MKSNGFPVLGIEGGGTKTTWALINASGKILREGKAGPGNLQHLDDRKLAALLKAIHAQAGGDARAIGSAFAGCHLPAERKRVVQALRKLWPKAEPVVAGEDTLSAFCGAHGRGKEGLIVIAGTGSNVQGHKDGRWEKGGGWGFLFADPGSGYDISRRGMEAVYHHYDKTREVTRLGHAFLRRTGQNSLAEFVPWVMEHSTKTEVADLVPCVFEAAAAGDRLALGVIHSRAEALADEVLFVSRRLGLKKPDIGLVGSLLEKNAFYRGLFRRAVAKRLAFGKFFASTVPGAVGAARIVADFGAGGSAPAKPARTKAAAPAIPYAAATTEARNPRSSGLDKKSVASLVDLFTAEEKYVHAALKKARPQLIAAASLVAGALEKGRRLFYVGAGTSGRLGVLDASEMPPTFNVPPDLVQGIIAGGFQALLRSQEGAEDNAAAGAEAVAERGVGRGDVVVGITASGTAPFVRGALEKAKKLGAVPILLACNPNLPKFPAAKVTVILPTGPELVTGSTRLKAGTATKLALNLFSTVAMIRTGRVRDNLMVNVQPTNQKLRDRALRLVMTLAKVDAAKAFARLEKAGWDVAKAAR